MPRTVGAKSANDANSAGLISDSMKVCLLQLEAVAKRIKTNKEWLTDEFATEINDNILDLGIEAANARFIYSKTVGIIDNVISCRNQTNEKSAEELKRNIKEKIAKEFSSFEATKDSDVVAISKIIKGSKDMDEDFIVDERNGLSAADITCPFTQQLLVEPMKNNGNGSSQPGCIHHVSKVALESMMCTSKNHVAKCPVPGCAGKWTRANSVVDTVFQKRIERHQRLMQTSANLAAASNQSSSTVVVTDEDENGVGYTQL